MATLEQLQAWHELAQQLRIDSIRATTAAGSGHLLFHLLYAAVSSCILI
jgi:transketolase